MFFVVRHLSILLYFIKKTEETACFIVRCRIISDDGLVGFGFIEQVNRKYDQSHSHGMPNSKCFP